MEIVEFIDTWLRKGRCENKTDHDITICVDGKPGVLKKGDTTPKSVDCDGIIHNDSSATKIYGQTGVKLHKSPKWVKRNWPACHREPPAPRERPDRPDPMWDKMSFVGGQTEPLEEETLTLPPVHTLVSIKHGLVGIPLRLFVDTLRQVSESSKHSVLKDVADSAEVFVSLPVYLELEKMFADE